MRQFEAVYQDGAFWPRDYVEIDSGSCVQLEIKGVHAPPQTPARGKTKWSWSAESLSDLEAAVLQALGDWVTTRALETINQRINKTIVGTERAPIEPSDMKDAISKLMKSGYIEASVAPATLQGYQITAMGKVCAILTQREAIQRRRQARGLPPRPWPTLPDLDVFVPNFQELDISFLQLGRRTFNVLKNNGFNTLNSICQLTPKELRQIDQIGRDSADTIMFNLERLGLALKPDPGKQQY